VGWNLGELSDFNHTGAVAGDSFVGGIVGYNEGTVLRSVFVGKLLERIMLVVSQG